MACTCIGKRLSISKLIYVADDEQLIARTLVLILESSGYEAFAFFSAEDILAATEQREPALVVSDVIMAGMTGIELCRLFAVRFPAVKFLLLSGQSNASDLIDSARRDGWNNEVHTKPLHPTTLLDRVSGLLSNPFTA